MWLPVCREWQAIQDHGVQEEGCWGQQVPFEGEIYHGSEFSGEEQISY